MQALPYNLDARLANGEISKATYNKLYVKWEERPKKLDGK